jgi:hypothetical protein
MRVAPLRWPTAELVPFGFLAVGLGLPLALPQLGGLFAVVGLIGGGAMSGIYVIKMHGASGFWLLPIILLYLGCFGVMEFTLNEGDNKAHPVVVTATWEAVAAALMVALAVNVAIAVATGERWARRNRARIAPSEAASWGTKQGNRGIWAPRVWLDPG